MASGINAGYKTSGYRAGWGYDHYGCDYGSFVPTGDNVIASGAGQVVTAGYDNAVGNVLTILYKDVYIHKTGKSQSLVARYMHLQSLAVKVGDAVTAGQVIGVEGNTGAGKWGIHLHVEFDTDTRPQYYNWSPQVTGSNIFKHGMDSTVNPSHIFYKRKDQRLTANYAPNYAAPDDINLPLWEETVCTCTKCAALEAENAELRAIIAAVKKAIA